MKKLLAASTALVAATAFAGAAQAADPIKLSLGGFAFGGVTYYDNEDSFLGTSETNNFVVTGDNEVHFKGSTTLDNGLTVAVKYEVRTGGQGLSNQADSNADEWSITTSGAFGSIIVGQDDIATEAVAIMAPHMGGRLLGAGLSEGHMIGGNFVQRPAAGGNAVNVMNASFINGNDENQISYVSNDIAGFTLGASYVPGLGNNAQGALISATGNIADTYGVGALWSGEFSGVGVKVSGGYAVGDMSNQTATTASTIDDWHQWQAGLGFDYAGFTLSGGYSKQDFDMVGATDGKQSAWEIGVGYKTGPYGVALGYFSSSVEDASAAGANDDEADIWQLTTQYTMGPGVMLVGGVAHADFDGGEVNTTADENSGVTVQTGLMLSF